MHGVARKHHGMDIVLIDLRSNQPNGHDFTYYRRVCVHRT